MFGRAVHTRVAQELGRFQMMAKTLQFRDVAAELAKFGVDDPVEKVTGMILEMDAGALATLLEAPPSECTMSKACTEAIEALISHHTEVMRQAVSSIGGLTMSETSGQVPGAGGSGWAADWEAGEALLGESARQHQSDRQHADSGFAAQMQVEQLQARLEAKHESERLAAQQQLELLDMDLMAAESETAKAVELQRAAEAESLRLRDELGKSKLDAATVALHGAESGGAPYSDVASGRARPQQAKNELVVAMANTDRLQTEVSALQEQLVNSKAKEGVYPGAAAADSSMYPRRSATMARDAGHRAKAIEVMTKLGKVYVAMEKSNAHKERVHVLIGEAEEQNMHDGDVSNASVADILRGAEDMGKLCKQLDMVEKRLGKYLADRMAHLKAGYTIEFATKTAATKTMELVSLTDMYLPTQAQLMGPSSVGTARALATAMRRMVSLFGCALDLLIPTMLCMIDSINGFGIPSTLTVLSGGVWDLGPAEPVPAFARQEYAAQCARLWLMLSRMLSEAVTLTQLGRTFGNSQQVSFTAGAPESDRDGLAVLHFWYMYHQHNSMDDGKKLRRTMENAYALPSTMGGIGAADEIHKRMIKGRHLHVRVGYEDLIKPLCDVLFDMSYRYALGLTTWSEWALCRSKCDYDDVFFNGLEEFLRDVRHIASKVEEASNRGSYKASAKLLEACVCYVSAVTIEEPGWSPPASAWNASVYGAGRASRGRQPQVPGADASASAAGGNCYGCGKPGHIHRECPTHPMGEKMCWKCGKPGHLQMNCPQPGDLVQAPRRPGKAKAAAATGGTEVSKCVVCGKHTIDAEKIKRSQDNGRKPPRYCDLCYGLLRDKKSVAGYDGTMHTYKPFVRKPSAKANATDAGSAGRIAKLEAQLAAARKATAPWKRG